MLQQLSATVRGQSCLWRTSWTEDGQGPCSVSPAEEPLRLLPERGLLSSASAPRPALHGSQNSTPPKKPTTYQGCRARKGLCMLGFINIIIQGQKEVARGWLVTLAAHDVGKTLALTVLRWTPGVRVGKGRTSECGRAGSSWHVSSSAPPLFQRHFISSIAGLPPLLNFFLPPTSSVPSCRGWIYSMPPFHCLGGVTCFVFLCPFNIWSTNPFVFWALVIIYSCIHFLYLFLYQLLYVSPFLNVYHP